ncbi:Chitin-inducible gibberellin-responsive protein [Hibiscus syriacus]|uniref:Chitin-inducible gibberellin-responsive protein n=1 Tax=Hibiscus syriacus TaxID=106335 RepID=A0A6A2ZGQ4_HIBSY|nr:Chitin-inducible gibberellin-responsive protein [Hibiscus syriacus]
MSSGDPTMVSSSVALLQERFRQLQKVREKREEKELLKLFSEPDHAAESIKRCEPNGLLSTFEPEMAFPSRQPKQDSLALGLNEQANRFQSHGNPSINELMA